MNYTGTIIEESLTDISVLKRIIIISTKVEKITPEHKTPWLTQWTLHAVEIPEQRADKIAQEISTSLDASHGSWYADYKNNKYHYIIFQDKVFKINRSKPEQYKEVVDHGITLGIPDYQLDFSPHIKEWDR